MGNSSRTSKVSSPYSRLASPSGKRSGPSEDQPSPGSGQWVLDAVLKRPPSFQAKAFDELSISLDLFLEGEDISCRPALTKMLSAKPLTDSEQWILDTLVEAPRPFQMRTLKTLGYHLKVFSAEEGIPWKLYRNATEAPTPDDSVAEISADAERESPTSLTDQDFQERLERGLTGRAKLLAQLVMKRKGMFPREDLLKIYSVGSLGGHWSLIRAEAQKIHKWGYECFETIYGKGYEFHPLSRTLLKKKFIAEP